MSVLKLHKKRGFTLIEMAIVIAIIGALIIAIMASTRLIETIKMQNVAREVRDLRYAMVLYVGRYGAFPGDFARANEFISGAQAGNGNGEIEWGDESEDTIYQLVKSGILEESLFENKDKEQTYRSDVSEISCFQTVVHPSSDKGDDMDGRYDGYECDKNECDDKTKKEKGMCKKNKCKKKKHITQENGDMEYPVTILGSDTKKGNHCNGGVLKPVFVEYLDKKFDDDSPMFGVVRVRLDDKIEPEVTFGDEKTDCISDTSELNTLSSKKVCNVMFKLF